jgi:hypothetical protein
MYRLTLPTDRVTYLKSTIPFRHLFGMGHYRAVIRFDNEDADWQVWDSRSSKILGCGTESYLYSASISATKFLTSLVRDQYVPKTYPSFRPKVTNERILHNSRLLAEAKELRALVEYALCERTIRSNDWRVNAKACLERIHGGRPSDLTEDQPKRLSTSTIHLGEFDE